MQKNRQASFHLLLSALNLLMLIFACNHRFHNTPFCQHFEYGSEFEGISTRVKQKYIKNMDTQENMPNQEQEQPIEEQSNTEQAQNEATEQNEEMSALDKVKGELAETKDKLLRHMAEFDNFRKRTARERIELVQTASKDLMVELLEILDDMDRATEQMEKTENLAQVKSGTILVFNKLRRTLEQKGLKAMETKNMDFDVEYHEAISEVPAPSPDMQGKVIDELQKGYFLNDKIIRHAKVVVGK